MSFSQRIDSLRNSGLTREGPAALNGGPSAAPIAERLGSVDLLRGFVMMLMALDHTRDFFGGSGANPRDVAEPALFLTRWITHYCAPTFILLAGLSACLYGARGHGTGGVSRYLFTRGLFLVVLEFTLIRIGWTFAPFSLNLLAGVVWAIGMSMIALSLLVYLPRAAIAGIAVAMIAGHNVLDSVQAEAFGPAAWLWTILHEQGLLRLGDGASVYVLYPLIPWIGVMAAGYALGPVYRLEARQRRRILAGLGGAMVLGFVLLRASNLYGDPQPWQMQATGLATVLSFINCEKYPPSLLYLMMTIGPALLLLAAFDGVRGRLSGLVTVFGRAPLLFYVAHLYLIHLLAIVYVVATYDDLASLLASSPPRKPPGYGLGLPAIYAVWVGVLVLLYPLCRWFAALKQRRRKWWLSYL